MTERASRSVNLARVDPRYAHGDDEQVSATALGRADAVWSSFLAEEA